MSRQTVVSVGDLVADIVVSIDHFPVEPAAHQLTREIRLEPGGAGNFLIAGARLGLRMVALGVLGDDPFGREAADVLEREGVDLRGLIRLPGTTTTTVIALTTKTRHRSPARPLPMPKLPVAVLRAAVRLSKNWTTKSRSRRSGASKP